MTKTTKQMIEDIKAEIAKDPEQKMKILRQVQTVGQKFLLDKDFKEFHEVGIKQARDRGDEELLMTFHLVGRTHESIGLDQKPDYQVIVAAIAVDFDDEDEKMAFFKNLGADFRKNNPELMLVDIIQVAEAWMIQRKDDMPEEDINIMPSQSPSRVEAIIVESSSLDHRHSFYSAEILRNDDDSLKGFKTMHLEQHNPEEPADPNTFVNRLSRAIYEGYAEALTSDTKEKE